MIFKTFNNDIDKISAKWGIFGKSFNDIGSAISGKISDINRNFQATDDLIGSIKNSGDSIWARLYPTKEQIALLEINVPELIDTTKANEYLDVMKQIDAGIHPVFKSYQDWHDELADGEKWIAKHAQSTQGQIRSLENVTEANQQARTSALAYNEQLKAGTIGAKAATIATKALAMALNIAATMLITWAIGKVVEAIDNYIHRTEKMQEALKESVSTFESVTSEVESLEEELKTCTERLAELQQLADNGTISVADEKELELLKETNEELERQIALKQAEQIAAQKDVLEDAKESSDTKVKSKYAINKTTGRRKNVYADEELLYAISDYNVGAEWARENADKFESGNYGVNAKSLEDASNRIQEMYDTISPTIEAYDALIEAGYALEGEEKTRYEQLKKAQDEYLLYNYNLNGTKEAFQGLNAEQQKNILLNRLASQGLSDTQAQSVLGSVSEENYDDLWDKDFSFTPPEFSDYSTAEEYGKAYAEAWLKGIENTVQNSEEPSPLSTKEQMISDLNDMSEGFEELDKIYESILDKDPFDFKLLDDDNFKETFSGLETYADFIEQITSNSDDITVCQDAFNNMVTEWLNSTKILENVTEENAKLTTSMLEQMGITNAAELVNEALANTERRLAVEEELLAAQKRNIISATTDLTNITASEIATLINEGIATQDTTAYLADMWLAKLDLNNLQIDTKSDVNNIIAIANACSASTEYVGALLEALSYFNSVSTSGGILAKGWAELRIKAILSQIQSQKLDPTTYYGKTASYGGGSSSDKTDNSGSSSSAKETEESFNWVERVIKKVQRTIDNLSKTVSATYKSWTTRNNALAQQISAINSEISTQQKAYDYYMKKANSLGLSSAYVNKIKDGTISIETITNESLIDKIKEYQDLYDQACDAQDAITDLKDEIASLARQRFDNVISEYDSQLASIEHRANMLEAYLDQTEARGYLASTKYYEALKQAEKENIALLEAEYASLTAQLENSMKTGNIEEGSEEWASMKEEIYGVEEALVEANTALIEYNNSMRELEWEVFDYLQDRISAVTDETQFLIDLMSSKDLHDDKGNLTDEGMATMGLHGQNYNVYMSQADQYAKEIEEINKELEVDPNNTELIERKEELLDLQRESILAAEDEKQAIIDLVQEGIEKELEALQDLIDSYTEALDSAKDLYDYQKRVKELTSEISSLEKQKSAYLGDDSEENQARIQQIKVKLEEARENLEETEYEHYISEQKKLLDTLFNEYEAMLNARLDNVDALLSDMIDTINANASTIDETLRAESEKVGYTMTDSLQDIWSNEGCATSIISKYGDGFLTQLTSVNNVLNAIAKKIGAMTEESDKQAETNIKNETAKQETKPSSSSTTTKPSTNTTTTTTKTIKVGGKINAGSAKIYDYVGDTSGETQYYKKDPVYTVLEEKSGYLKVRHHSLSSGITGWFKKSDVKAYKTGGLVDETGLAWLDGTKTKPELVLNSKDTENIVGAADTLRNMVTKGILSQLNDFTETYGFNGGLPKIPSSTSIGDVTNQINIAIDRVLDYNDFCNQLREDPQFEKMVQAMTTDQIAGKSKLAKNKFRW